MSKHRSRKERWAHVDAQTYRTFVGAVTHSAAAWYAIFDYRTRNPCDPAQGSADWVPHHARLGPFKRARNAMVALEREVMFLQNRFGSEVLFG